MTSLNLSGARPSTVRTDALVIALAEGKRGPAFATDVSDLDAAFDGGLLKALKALGATGRPEQVVKLATLGAVKAPLVVAVGVGAPPKGGYTHETVRRAAGAAVRALAGTSSVTFVADDNADAVVATAEGALLGAYAFTTFRGAGADLKGQAPVSSVTILTALNTDANTKRGVKAAGVVADGVALARDLVNTPPSALHPKELADAAVKAAKGTKLEVTVLDEKALKKKGYGGIIAVGQGSVNPPRLVQLTHTHPKAKKSIALVGKGITFDSGGLSLKPPTAMEAMKSDMGGAAAVIAALAVIAKLNLPVNVTGWAAIAENMPSGTAQRPSDVYTAYDGTTVEVMNTDAEGRLVLADAIARACEDSPDLLIDAATLTGAQMVALGNRTSGAMGNDDDARASVVAAADAAGEAMWPMPLPEELRASLDSDVADLKNIGERFGGMMTAAVFLQEFVADGVPWVHLDIAGPAFSDKAFGYTPKGGTGAAVRTFVEVALRMSRNQL